MTDTTTNPEVGAGEAVADVNEGVDTDALADDGFETETEGDEPDEFDENGEPIQPPDEMEDLEFEGVKAKVPKALAEAIKLGALRTADYTRKAQAVSASKAALEQEAQQVRANLAERTNLVTAHAADLISLKTVETRLSQLEAVTQDQWLAARALDRENGTTTVDDLQWERGQLREEKARIEADLNSKVQQMEAERQRETATVISQSRAELERSIPGWSGQRLNELQTLAKSYGFSDAELGQALHPGYYKVLNELATLKAAAAKTTTASKAQAKVAVSQAAAPVAQVRGASAPVRKSPEQMSPEEYRDWRQGQQRARTNKGRFA